MPRIRCWSCDRTLRFADQAQGKPIVCPACGKKSELPAPTSLRPSKEPGAILGKLGGISSEEIKELGAPVALYKSDVKSTILIIVFAVALMIMGPFFSTWAVIDRKMFDAPAVSLGCGSLTFLVGFGVLLLTWWTFGSRVAVFTNGLVQVCGRRVDVVPWDEIESVRQNITDWYDGPLNVPVLRGSKTETTHRYTIQTRGEEKTFILGDDVIDVQTLGETIQQEVTRIQLPAMRAALQEGEQLEFGPLLIDNKGLAHEKDLVSWGEIKGLRVEKGVFKVSKKGKWFSWAAVKVSEIDNLFVFLTIVDDIIGVDGE